MARCPFHGDGKESTPSMTVNDEKGMYYCFGCGQSGDVFTFLQELEGVDFRGALMKLADRYGISARGGGASTGIPAGSSPKASGSDPVMVAHKAAANVFIEAFKHKEDSGVRACGELLAKRGVKLATAVTFGLGYAPPGGCWVSKQLAKEVSQQVLIDSKLSRRSMGGQGKVVDYFQGRLMIPIHDGLGRPIGFGARSIPGVTPGLAGGVEAPKYINSPEVCDHTRRGAPHSTQAAQLCTTPSRRGSTVPTLSQS